MSTEEHQFLSSIIENEHEINTLNNLEKEFVRVSPSIPYIDDSDSSEKRLSLNYSQQMSLSESDLLTSLHRQIDNTSNDDLLFLEWDKERTLFQDYINSLRKEIRVLLQERFEYQQQTSYKSDEQMKIDLLQKSLEEKNFVFEQLQHDYELTKEKNTNLTKKLSSIQSDTTSYLNIIDELKQKIADLTIDLQNHILVKRRLEMSIENLENDCKILDNERIRLTNDIKENQHGKQDLEKLVQKANVQIAEQGSTIEMLRSENVQVRSQLSTIQRRMFQEKQQIMDYLRQIENDLIEKEQIKQRESSLRHDYEQLKSSLEKNQNDLLENKDNIELLTNQCSQLEEANKAWQDYQQNQLDNFRNKFQNILPNQSQISLEEIAQFIFDYIFQLTKINSHSQISALLTPTDEEQNSLQLTPLLVHEDDSELRQLRDNISSLTMQCSQLNEANQAWQQFQYDQMKNFRNKLDEFVSLEENISFDQAAQMIIDQYTQLNKTNQVWQDFYNNHIELIKTQLKDYVNFDENLTFNQMMEKIASEFEKKTSQESTTNGNNVDEIVYLQDEIRSLENRLNEQQLSMDSLKSQLQLTTTENEQLNSFREKLQDLISFENNSNLEAIAEHIRDQFERANQIQDYRNKIQEYLPIDVNAAIDQILQERENLEKAKELEIYHLNTIQSLNQELADLKIVEQKLVNENKTCLDRSFERIDQQNQTDSFESFSDDENLWNDERFNEIFSLSSTELSNQLQKESEQILSKQNLNISSPSTIMNLNQLALLTIRSLLNQHLIDEAKLLYNETILKALKEEYEFLNNEKNDLNQQIEFEEQLTEYKNQLASLLEERVNHLIQIENLKSPSKQTIDNESQTDDHQTDKLLQINNKFKRVLQTFKEKINRIVIERSDLFDGIGDETSERLDRLILIVENQTKQIDLDEHTLTVTKYESLLDNERQDLLENQREMDRLKEELVEIKQLLNSYQEQTETGENIEILKSTIEEQSKQLKDLADRNDILSAQLVSQTDLSRETIEQLSEYEIQLNNLEQERLKLFEELEKKIVSSKELTDSECQTDDRQYEKIVQMNNKLKRALQIFKEKMNRIVTQRPELFDGVGEETSERLDHLLVTVDNQTKQIEDKYQNQINALENSLKAMQYELDNERQIRIEQLSIAAPLTNDIDYEKQIAQLQQSLSQKDEEQTLLREHFIELKKTFDDQASQLQSQNDLIKQINEYESQLEDLKQERIRLFDEIEKKTLPIIQKSENESQTDDRQYEKLVQMNSKFKRALQTIKDKINRLVKERSDLFDGIGEETNERLDHLILTIENQATQIDVQNTEYDQMKKQLQNDINELRSLLAIKQDQIEQSQQERDVLNKQHQHEIEQLREQVQQIEVQTEENIDELQVLVQQQSEELKDLQEKSANISSQLQAELEELRHQKEIETNDYKIQIDNLVQERAQLMDEIEKKTIPVVETVDAESQTDDRQHKKLVQANNKLKGIVQILKDKLDRLVTEKPDLFNDVDENISDRFDHLISTVENQTVEINTLQRDCVQLEEQLQDEVQQLQQKLSEKDNKRDSLNALLKDVQTKLEKANNDLTEKSLEYDELKKPVDSQQVEVQTEEDINAFQVLIEQQSKELQQLQQRCTDLSSQIQFRNELQVEFEKLKSEKDAEIDDYRHQIESLVQERTHLMEETEKNTIPLVETNNKLKETMQSMKDKMDRLATKKPDLSNGIDEDISDRINHLISTVENQAVEISTLQTVHDQLVEQLQNELEETKENQSQFLQQHQHETAQLKREYDQVRAELEDLKKPVDSQQVEVQTEEDINKIEELQKRCADLAFQANSQSKLEAELENLKNQREVEINEYQSQIESFVKERTKLTEELEKKTVENESPLGNEFNESLETIKDKINRLIVEREDLFNDIGEDIDERLDYIISLVENQATQIDILEAERDQREKQMKNEIKQLQSSLEDSRKELENERQSQAEQLSSASMDNNSSNIEEYEKQIEQLQQNVVEKQNERDSLAKRINDMEFEFKTQIDDHAALTIKYDAIVEQQRIESIEKQREIEQMQEELAALQHKPASQHIEIQTDDNIETSPQLLQQQSSTSSRNSEDEFYECESQIDDLDEEPTTVSEQIDAAVQRVDSETQTDDRQHRRLVQTTNKLKGIVQTLKDKLDRLVTENPHLFDRVDEDISDRFDHLITIVENQTIQINTLQTDRNQLQNEIQQLRGNLSEKDVEQNSLVDRLKETQSQLEKTEENQSQFLQQHQHETAQLKSEYDQVRAELEDLKKPVDSQQVEVQTEEDINAFQVLIEQQSKELQQLQQRCTDLSSQIQFRNELQVEFEKLKSEKDAEIDDYRHQIESLVQERTHLMEETEKNTIPLVETNNKLKETMQSMKDKMDRLATKKPDLSNDVDENISNRLDHLISTIENQVEQIHSLEIDYNQLKEQLQNEIQQLQQKLSEKDAEQNSLDELLKATQAKLEKANDDLTGKSLEYEDQLRSLQQQRDLSIEQLRMELDELKKPVDSQQVEVQTEENINALQELIEQQSEELQSLQKKCSDLSSQLDSQSKLEIELESERTQIENLMQERAQLMEEIEKKTIPVVETVDVENQIDDDEKKDLIETNTRLKEILQTMKDRMDRLATEKSDLSNGIDEDISDRINHLISTVENQVVEINALQTARDQLKEQLENEIKQLRENLFEKDIEQNSLTDRLKEVQSQFEKTKEDLSTKSVEFEDQLRSLQQERDLSIEQLRAELDELKKPVDSQQVEIQTDEDINALETLIENQSQELKNLQEKCADLSSQIDSLGKLQTEKEVEIHDYKKQVENLREEIEKKTLSVIQTVDSECQTDDRQHRKSTLQTLKEKINRIVTEQPNLFDGIDEDTNDQLDHLISIVVNQTEKIDVLQKELDQIHSIIKIKTSSFEHVHTQTLGLSIVEDYQKQIDKYQENQQDIQRLTQRIENTNHDSSSSNEAISRHMYEQEMLAWSKESEQLKSFVKQIQIENQKLKNLITKFENMIHDYIHENERLKQENLYKTSANLSLITNKDDQDICYLLLKCLTYEVERREQIMNINDNQEKNDYEKQFKTLRNQNERLKSQLESYTIHFKHVQHEMNLKIQELTKFKDEIGRLQLNDIQYRLEIDRLKTELETDQSKIQELEHELSNKKFQQTNHHHDSTSLNNLHELVELKEREIIALKEKLDYTKQTHQIELCEAQKSNQFSLDNVKRFEQMDLSYEEKRKELESRLKKFCRLTRPLMNNRQLFVENPIINLDELGKLINQTDTEERITTTLSPIRDCLSLLEAQMKDLHHNIIENHARRSKRWKYKLGFECLSCESRWEVTHDIRDLQEACLDPSRFLESSIVEPMAVCSCPIVIDFIESDIRLCLDDILTDVVSRIDVK